MCKSFISEGTLSQYYDTEEDEKQWSKNGVSGCFSY